MNKSERAYYDRYRKRGYTATDAMRAAKVRVAWDDAESQDLVRVHVEPEWECWEDSFDRQAFTDSQWKEIAHRVDRDGYWIYVTQYRLTTDDEWQTAESVGGFIGEGWRGSGHDIDMMQSALDMLDRAYQDEADKLAVRATYAGV